MSFASLPFAKVANLLAFMFLLLSFLLIIRNSLAAQVRMFAAQSGVLSALAAVVAYFGGSMALFGVAMVFAIMKVIVIPNVLMRAVTKIGLQRSVAPYLSMSPTLAICGGLVVVAFYVMAPVTASIRTPANASGMPSAVGRPLEAAQPKAGSGRCRRAIRTSQPESG